MLSEPWRFHLEKCILSVEEIVLEREGELKEILLSLVVQIRETFALCR